MNGSAFHVGLTVTAFGFGFRHGIDWDHIAALTDITSSQQHPRRSMFFATMYALGHGLVVAALGFAAIVLAARVPSSIDATMERIVGATLIALGAYVFYALAKRRRDFRMRSRWMLVFAGVRRARRRLGERRGWDRPVEIVHEHDHAVSEDHDHSRRRVPVQAEHLAVHFAGVTGAHSSGLTAGSEPVRTHRHVHRHRGRLPDDPFVDYAPRTAFGIGMLHGVGAETPTQLLIFLTAAGVGGKGAGLLLLACFLVGLLSSNTVVALAGTFGFLGAARNFKVYVAVSVVTATFSLVVGCVFLVGGATVLPALLGG